MIQQGGLDLSVPGVISLAAVLVTKFPDGDNAALIPWIAAAIASGFLSGLICGIAITRFSVTALVATLAVNALRTAPCCISPRGLRQRRCRRCLAALPSAASMACRFLRSCAALTLLIEIGVRATVWGRRFVAVGVSARAARAASLRVTTYKVATYGIAGAFYALSGVLLAGYLRVPSLLVGNSYLLPTITVVVLGGTSLLGGAGSVAATAIGAIFLVQLQQVVIGIGAPTSAQFVIQAGIILLGMAIRVAPWRVMFDVLRRPPADAGAGRPSG